MYMIGPCKNLLLTDLIRPAVTQRNYQEQQNCPPRSGDNRLGHFTGQILVYITVCERRQIRSVFFQNSAWNDYECSLQIKSLDVCGVEFLKVADLRLCGWSSRQKQAREA